MNQYERVPHALTYDTNLSLGARAAYPLLRDLAWKAGRRESSDAVELPPVDKIAETLGCAPATAKRYLAELRAAGWISVTRAARNRPALYRIWDDAEVSNQDRPRSKNETTSAPSLSSSTDVVIRTPTGSIERAEKRLTHGPALVRVGGKDLALEALLSACGIHARSPRIVAAAVALNGRQGQPETGIRSQRWAELCEKYPERTSDPSLIAGEQYEAALAAAILKRAEMYRAKLPGATLTPTALAKWWTDLPTLDSRGGLTPEKMVQMAHDLAQGEQ